MKWINKLTNITIVIIVILTLFMLFRNELSLEIVEKYEKQIKFLFKGLWIILTFFIFTQLYPIRKYLWSEIKKQVALSSTLFLSVIAVFLTIFADKLSPNQAAVAGNAFTAIAAFLVLLVTFSRDRMIKYEQAMSSAKALGQILRSVYNQFRRIENGKINRIIYPSNWMELYCDCAKHLKYEYWDAILREFEFADQINNSFENKDEIKNICEERNNFINCSGMDFDIIYTSGNLIMFGSQGKEIYSPWKEQKDNIEFKKYFIENHQDYIEKITIDYLKSKGGRSDANEVLLHISSILKEDGCLKYGKYKFCLYDSKVLFDAIYQVFLDNYTSNKNKAISLIWGELFLEE